MNNQFRYRRAAALALLLLTLGLSSCGYRNPYVVRGEAKAVRLYRPLWINRTSELGLESLLARELSSWLHKNRAITQNSDPEQAADYTLKGSITGIATPELSYGAFDRANELSLRVTVSFTLSENATGLVKWERKDYPVTEAYAVSENSLESAANKKVALTKISKRLGEEIYLHLLNTVLHEPEGASK